MVECTSAIETEIDRAVLSSQAVEERALSAIHSSKRGRNEREGVHSWHPYYAAYSEQFVRDVLGKVSPPDAIVLDPWNGSGTTTLVAQQEGHSAIGIEINPVMVIHAIAKTVFPSTQGRTIKQRAKRVVAAAKKMRLPTICQDHRLREYLPADAIQPLLSIYSAILQSRPESVEQPLEKAVLSSSSPSNSRIDQATAFLTSALFQCLKKVGKIKAGSNPTWLLKGESCFTGDACEIYELFLERVESMLLDLPVSISSVPQALVLEGDARKLPILDACIDIIVTSPPYCTRIDYIVSTVPELLCLGFDYDMIRRLRKSTMGSPLKIKDFTENNLDYGETCMNFLSAVSNHASKASKSYYLPIYQQYFHDAYRGLAEIRRVLKVGGYAVLVIQSSYYKEIELDLGQMYVEMARNIGLDAYIAVRQPVRQHMAHLNRSSRKYTEYKTYHEDVILFQKQIGSAPGLT